MRDILTKYEDASGVRFELSLNLTEQSGFTRAIGADDQAPLTDLNG
jgi:hypothetical protein